METVIGSVSEDYGQVLVLLLVLDMTQLVVDGAQVFEAVGLSAHFDPEIL